MTEDFWTSEWFTERPKAVRDTFEKYPPYNTYRLTTTGQIVFLHCIDENRDGSCTECKINILPEANPNRFMPFAKQVFGISLSDLEDLGFTEPWNNEIPFIELEPVRHRFARTKELAEKAYGKNEPT